MHILLIRVYFGFHLRDGEDHHPSRSYLLPFDRLSPQGRHDILYDSIVSICRVEVYFMPCV